MSLWQGDGLVVTWLMGGVYIESGGDGLLLDVPPGSSRLMSPTQLGRLRAVALSGGRMQSIGGMVGLLCQLEPGRSQDAALSLWFALGHERGPMLAETWVRGWGRYPVTLDAEAPGAEFDVGAMAVKTVSYAAGEPRWGDEPTVESRQAVGFRVTVAGQTIAYAPAAARPQAVQRLVRGADLAIVEVGAVPWPRSDRQWRLTLADAVQATADVQNTWIVGDDGHFVGGEGS